MDTSLDIKETIPPKELAGVLNDIYLYEVKKGGVLTKDPLLAAELMLNWILNVHDR